MGQHDVLKLQISPDDPFIPSLSCYNILCLQYATGACNNIIRRYSLYYHPIPSLNVWFGLGVFGKN